MTAAAPGGAVKLPFMPHVSHLIGGWGKTGHHDHVRVAQKWLVKSKVLAMATASLAHAGLACFAGQRLHM